MQEPILNRFTQGKDHFLRLEVNVIYFMGYIQGRIAKQLKFTLTSFDKGNRPYAS